MKIGVVYLGRRGSGGAFALEAAHHLASFSQVFAVVCRQAENYPLWQAGRVPFQGIDTYTNGQQALGSLVFQRRIRELAADIRRSRPDVLFFPMFHPWNPFLQAYLRDIPSVIIVHDPAPHPGLVDRVYQALETRSVRQAGQCIILSQSLKPAIEKRGAAPGSVAFVPMPDHSYYRKYYSAPKQTGSRGQNLLFFGRITAYKGLEVLLQAYREMAPDKRPELRIVGEGNLAPYRELLQGLEKVCLENRWVAEADVGSYFESGTIVVLPYTSASQSGVLEVAASFGLPVIATRTGGIPEQIQDGESGLLVDPNDAGQLRQAIERLLRDPQFAGQLGKRLQSVSKSERGWDTAAQKIFEICRRAAFPEEG